MHKLDMNKKNPRKTRMLIDELSSRKCGKTRNIAEIKVNNESFILRLKWQKSLTIILQMWDQIW